MKQHKLSFVLRQIASPCTGNCFEAAGSVLHMDMMSVLIIMVEREKGKYFVK